MRMRWKNWLAMHICHGLHGKTTDQYLDVEIVDLYPHLTCHLQMDSTRMFLSVLFFLSTLYLVASQSAADIATQGALDLPANLKPINFPTYFLALNSNGEVVISDNPAEKLDLEFSPPLTGTAGALSIRETTTGKFLRHQSFRLKLHHSDGSDLFKNDATFMKRNALHGDSDDARSYESLTSPDITFVIKASTCISSNRMAHSSSMRTLRGLA